MNKVVIFDNLWPLLQLKMRTTEKNLNIKNKFPAFDFQLILGFRVRIHGSILQVRHLRR